MGSKYVFNKIEILDKAKLHVDEFFFEQFAILNTHGPNTHTLGLGCYLEAKMRSIVPNKSILQACIFSIEAKWFPFVLLVVYFNYDDASLYCEVKTITGNSTIIVQLWFQ